jgi:peptidoglycan/LPS O-acetylase OafA/YrhL
MFEFLIGMAVGVIYSRGWVQRVSLSLAIGMIIVSFFFIAAKEYRFAYFKIVIPLIVIAAIFQEKRFQRLSFMRALGDWSYYTYLYHVLVLSIAYRVSLVSQLNPYLALSAVCIVIMMVSWLSFTIVERISRL